MFPKLDCISRFCEAKLVSIQFIEYDRSLVLYVVLYITLTLILIGFFLAFNSLMLSLNRSVNRSLFFNVIRCKADESS
jgi:hypothetical protein